MKLALDRTWVVRDQFKCMLEFKLKMEERLVFSRTTLYVIEILESFWLAAIFRPNSKLFGWNLNEYIRSAELLDIWWPNIENRIFNDSVILVKGWTVWTKFFQVLITTFFQVKGGSWSFEAPTNFEAGLCFVIIDVFFRLVF